MLSCGLLVVTFIACAPVSMGEDAFQSEDFIRAHGADLVVGPDNSPILLRGVNFSNYLWLQTHGDLVGSQHHSEIDFRRVADMGMNVVRFCLNYRLFEADDAPFTYLQDGWEWLDQQIEWARTHGIFLILDLHVPQGGFQCQDDAPSPLRRRPAWRMLRRGPVGQVGWWSP